MVCLLTHEELKPLFQVCKALRTTVRHQRHLRPSTSQPTGPDVRWRAADVRNRLLCYQPLPHVLELSTPPSLRPLPPLQLHNAVAFHFNFSTPSRHIEEAAPPALGERQKRPARTNAIQVSCTALAGGRQAGSWCMKLGCCSVPWW